MHHLNSLLAIAPSLLLCLLTPSYAHIPADTLRSDHLRLPPFRLPQPLSQPQDPRTLLIRWRDRIIRSLWSVPESQCRIKATRQGPAAKASPPQSLLSRYGGDMVLRFNVSSADEAKALAEAIDVLILDVWEFTTDWVDIRLSRDIVPSLLGLLPPSLQHAHTPLMHDLAQTIYESYPSLAFQQPSSPPHDTHRTFSPSLRPSPPSETNIFFREYQPLSVIIPWMRLLQSLFPSHVRMINIGITYEGRDIPALRVGVHPNSSEKPSRPRKTIIVAGGSHAREWISTSTVNYIAYSFITGYGKSKSMTELLEKFDFIFLPVLNVDGYIYTWENDRLWRKTRQQTSLRFCKGLDLDHSWSFEWDHSSSSKSNPCSEGFSGEEPFEAVESRRLANWVRNETEHNNVTFVGFLDFHSYSQQVLYPYSYSCTDTPPSLENLQELAIGLAKAIRLTNSQIYGVTSACEGSVTAGKPSNDKKSPIWPRVETGGGSALDWFYHEARVPYAYQIKLRDTGSYGFLLPADNIVPTGEEALAAVKYLGSWLLGNKGIESEDEEKGDFARWRESTKPVVRRPMEVGHQTQEVEHGVDEAEAEGVMQWELKRRRR